MPDAWDHFAAVKMDFFRILALGQVVLVGVRNNSGTSRFSADLKRVPALVPGIAGILAGVVALGFSISGHGKPLAVLDGLLASGLFVMLVAEGDRVLAGKMLTIYAGSAGLAAVYGLAQYSGFDLFEWKRAFAGSAPASTFGNPLFLGDGLACALPIAVMGLFSSRRYFRVLFLFLALILAAGLLVSQARGAWAGAFVSLAVLFVLIGGATVIRNSWVRVFGVGLAVIVFWGFHPDPLNPGGDPVFRKAEVLVRQGAGGLRGRFLLWESTALMMRENPVFGAGRGEFPGRYNLFQGPLLAAPKYAGLEYHSTGHAHQDYLQMGAESGVMGLGLFLWLVVSVVAGYRRKIPDLKAVNYRTVAIGGLAVFLVDGFFNGPFHVPPSAQWVWLVMGISSLVPPGGGEARNVGRRRLPFLANVLLGLVVVMAARSFARDLVSEVYLREARLALDKNQAGIAVERAINSYALSAEDRRHRFVMGQAYYLAGRYGDAVEQFARDAEENPGMASTWHNLGLSLRQSGKFGLAVQSFERAALLDPTDGVIRELLRESGKASQAHKKGN